MLYLNYHLRVWRLPDGSVFTEGQLNNMGRENMMEVMRIMQNQVRKKETEIQLLKDRQKELEFMNAMLSDRFALAQRRRFGSSGEKYADGYEQMDLFNEAEVNADTDTAEIEEEIVIPSHKRKKSYHWSREALLLLRWLPVSGTPEAVASGSGCPV